MAFGRSSIEQPSTRRSRLGELSLARKQVRYYQQNVVG
jgi:hypothetical protein